MTHDQRNGPRPMMLVEAIAQQTTTIGILDLLARAAQADDGVSEGYEQDFALGFLAAYVAQLHAEAISAAAHQGEVDDVLPLRDEDVADWIANVNIAKLRKLLATRQLDVVTNYATDIHGEPSASWEGEDEDDNVTAALKDMEARWGRCPDCDGHGKILGSTHACMTCAGDGIVDEDSARYPK